MTVTVRYTKQHDNQSEGRVRAIVPELPVTVAYGDSEGDAQRKILDQVLIGLSLLIRTGTAPDQVFPLSFREEHSAEGY